MIHEKRRGRAFALLTVTVLLSIAATTGVSGQLEPVDEIIDDANDDVCYPKTTFLNALNPVQEDLFERCGHWIARYDGPASGFDEAREVAASPDGSRVFVTGVSLEIWTGLDWVTAAYDPTTGEQLWRAQFDGENSEDQARGIAVSPDGSTVFVAGTIITQQGAGLVVVNAYDAASGAELWSSTFDHAWIALWFDRPAEGVLQVSPDGDQVFLTAYSGTGSIHGPGFRAASLDAATGQTVWESGYAFPGPPGTTPSWRLTKASALSPDGSTLYVGGNARLQAPGFSIWQVAVIVGFNTTTGALDWSTSIGGVDDWYEVIGLEVHPDGDHVYLGMSGSIGAAFETETGNNVWTEAHPQRRGAFDIAISADGAKLIFIGGKSGFIGPPGRFTTVAQDTATGEVIWTAYSGQDVLDAAYDEVRETGRRVVVDPDNSRVYVAGYSERQIFIGAGVGPFVAVTNPGLAVAAYDLETGEEAWMTHYDSAMTDSNAATGQLYEMGLGISPDGSRLFVAAGTDKNGGNGIDFTTISYSLNPDAGLVPQGGSS